MSLVPFCSDAVLLLFRHLQHPLAPFSSLLRPFSTHVHTRSRARTLRVPLHKRERIPSFFSPALSFSLAPFFSPTRSFIFPVALSPSKHFSLSLSPSLPPPLSSDPSTTLLPHARVCFYARSGAPVTLCATLCVPLEPHYPRVKVSLWPTARLQDAEEDASRRTEGVETKPA